MFKVKYSQTCLQRSAMGNYKVAFVDRWPLFGIYKINAFEYVAVSA